ncbi:MAG: DUF5615 family PIN-like protein [Candidatus Hydrogenedentes bacterium]|nr:DUF5615 family PIN-like protein [Candidatus Hydrogenedentota bacterium]
MTKVLRFHLDEHIHPAVAEALKRRGIDVTTTYEAGLSSATDLQQLDYSQEERRVLVTQDADFLRLHRAGQPHAGVVFCRQKRLSVGDISRGLILLRECLSAEEMVNHIEFL